MISQIELCLRHRGRIARKRDIVFKPGLNVIIGSNGSGKSSLLEAIHNCPDCSKREDGSGESYYFNSEIMNPHNPEHALNGPLGSLLKVRGMFSSHGETMRDVLSSLAINEGGCLLLDEPESGQDLKWVIKIRQGLDILVSSGFQVILATHHPVFWKNVNVIELERNYYKKTLESFKENF